MTLHDGDSTLTDLWDLKEGEYLRARSAWYELNTLIMIYTLQHLPRRFLSAALDISTLRPPNRGSTCDRSHYETPSEPHTLDNSECQPQEI
jgi:hypothetical protein